jgi:hypothetical protein
VISSPANLRHPSGVNLSHPPEAEKIFPALSNMAAAFASLTGEISKEAGSNDGKSTYYSGFHLRASRICSLTPRFDKLQFVVGHSNRLFPPALDKLKFVGHFPQDSLNCKPL